MDSVISTILADTSNPNWALQGIQNTFVKPIFINTNACFNNNWELTKEAGDPGKQLEYLANELAEAAGSSNKKVWIIGNVAPGNKHCNSRWAQRYNALVERYQATIVFQGFGYDELETF